MDQVVGLGESVTEKPRVGPRCNGMGAVAAADESIVRPATAGQRAERLPPSTDRQSDHTACEHGEPSDAFGPRILPPDDDGQKANRESLTLVGRPDIDAAIVLALRSTVVARTSFPMHSYLAPDQNLVDSVNPRGER